MGKAEQEVKYGGAATHLLKSMFIPELNEGSTCCDDQ